MGEGGLNLTWYHTEFLSHLCEFNVPHIIIGGQARAYHFGTNTFDLDILMPVDNTEDSPVHNALIKWYSRYSNHFSINNRICKPFTINPNTQILIPDAVVSVLTETKTILKITEKTRIDVLFLIADLDFESAYKRGITIDQFNLNTKVLCKQDAISTQRIPK